MGGYMSDPLITEQVVAAGFFGLNTQESSVTLSNAYALALDNAVIDSFGRIGARKGIQKLNTTAYDGKVGCLHESVSTNGVRDVLSVSSKKFYKGMPSNVLKFTHPEAVGNNWTGVNLNNHAYFFQRGLKPVVYDIATDTVELVENHPFYSGTVPKANCALGAFGRLWVADTDTNKSILYYSDTLIGHKWTGGSAGSIDLTTVFPNGGDEIVSLASFNNRLVIFARKSIIIYSGAEDPTTMVVEDSLDTLGCVSRDTVQDTGADVIFLSETGLKSLGRVVDERSNPLNDLSINVKDIFIGEFASENTAVVRSVYYERDSFYLLSLPAFKRVWCFDTRQKLENGAFKATTWSEFEVYSFLATSNKTLLVGDSDFDVSIYDKYNMKGQTYTFSYLSNHLNSGDSSTLKLLKKLSIIVVGGAQALTLKYGTNYSNSLKSISAAINSDTIASEYGIAEYDIGKYNTGFTNQKIERNIGGSGAVYQIGVSAQIKDSLFSLQQLVIKFKKGRLS
jgi:hypothetical protein